MGYFSEMSLDMQEGRKPSAASLTHNTLNMLGALIEFLQTTRRVTTECRDGVFIYTKVPGAEAWDIESELSDL